MRCGRPAGCGPVRTPAGSTGRVCWWTGSRSWSEHRRPRRRRGLLEQGSPKRGPPGPEEARPGACPPRRSPSTPPRSTSSTRCPASARHIIDYRTAHGGFRSVDELREVNGIGDRRFSDLRDLVQP
ncbi:ComEA family DNA-binding protein [Streptomyces sp. NPDC005244]|uniref:ComEA family DNA-binding protein n=1 Tax=Streptomyces sp. NPDC005244 TaxID=3364708 RepID=UPI0036903FA8